MHPSVIVSGARYCIAGANLSMVFVDKEPPAMSPNLKLQVQLSYVKRFVVHSKNEEENQIDKLSKEVVNKNWEINSWRDNFRNERLKFRAKTRTLETKLLIIQKENKELIKKLEKSSMEKQKEAKKHIE